MEETQRYRQQSEEAFQGAVPDAQHWLWFRQEDQAHAQDRLQEVPRT